MIAVQHELGHFYSEVNCATDLLIKHLLYLILLRTSKTDNLSKKYKCSKEKQNYTYRYDKQCIL